VGTSAPLAAPFQAGKTAVDRPTNCRTTTPSGERPDEKLYGTLRYSRTYIELELSGNRFNPSARSIIPSCVYRSIVKLIVEWRLSN
jgi:hypothetical protein